MKNQKKRIEKFLNIKKSTVLIPLDIIEMIEIRGGTGQGSWDDR